MPVPVKPNTFSNTPANTNPIDADQVNANFDTLYSLLNAGVDGDNLAAAVRQALGLSDGSTSRRGKSIIATAETRTNTAYGTLPTPDQVTVALPTDGLLFVAFQATWRESVSGGARAAIFIGANQLVNTPIVGAPLLQEVGIGGTANNDVVLSTLAAGLTSPAAQAGGYSGDATTGQALGGVTSIFAAAGTYTVGVQFKASSGSVTVKNRKLWVWTTGF